MSNGEFQDVAHFLSENSPPSAVETLVIQSVVLQLGCDLGSLDAKISQTQLLLKHLLYSKKRKISERKKWMGALSALRRIPAEVVVEIALLSLSHDSPIQDVLYFGQICSGWRRIVFSTPRLWTSCNLVLPSPRIAQRLLQSVEEWLDRAGVLPLSLRIDDSDLSAEPAKTREMLPMLLSRSHQWRDIHMNMPRVGGIRRGETFHWDNLESLVFIATIHTSDLHVLSLFASARKLRSVSIFLPISTSSASSDAAGNHFIGTAIQALPLSQLTTLALQIPIFPQKFLAILQSCDNLTTCEISLEHPVNDLPSGKTIVAPKLRSLTLSGTSWISWLLDSLELPVLTAFCIDTKEDTQLEFPTRPFASLISRSHCTLESFSLLSIRCAEKDFVDLLHELPSLSELELRCRGSASWVTDEFLQALLWDSEYRKPFLLPQLRTFKIETDNVKFTIPCFLDMLSSRRSTRAECQNLQYVRVKYSEATEEQRIPSTWVTRLREQGLDIEFDSSCLYALHID